MKRILLVEDAPAFAVALIDRLESESYKLEWAQTGPSGYEMARTSLFDLIILDVMLPGGQSGFDVCRDLRHEGINTPILMLTARGELVDRVVGLKLGADDYVQKNCETIELMARIEAILRRSGATSSTSRDRVELGDVRVDFISHEAMRAGVPIVLSPIEFRLLEYMSQRRGIVIAREELLEKVWSVSSETLSRTVDVHVAGLRKKIESDSRHPRFLLTIKGLGYKLA